MSVASVRIAEVLGPSSHDLGHLYGLRVMHHHVSSESRIRGIVDRRGPCTTGPEDVSTQREQEGERSDHECARSPYRWEPRSGVIITGTGRGHGRLAHVGVPTPPEHVAPGSGVSGPNR